MQVRVSAEINEILDDAAALGMRRGQPFVGVDNLFEAILKKHDRLPHPVVERYQHELNLVAQELARDAWRGSLPVSSQDVFYTPRCAKILNNTAKLGERYGNGYAGAGHLLLALLADEHSAPARAMTGMRLNREGLMELLRTELFKRKTLQPVRQSAAKPKEAQTRASAVPTQSPEETPVEEESAARGLEELTRDLTALAQEGSLEPAIGRDEEIYQILEILNRKNKSNVILVGEAGVGKTCIVEGLALLLTRTAGHGFIDNCRILELNIASLTSGTAYRGAFEERIQSLLRQIHEAGDIILFIDEIHLMMGAGATDGSSVDLANLLKPALARNELRCIGATTIQEYRKVIQKDPAIERRFQMVRVEELSDTATKQVLHKLKPILEKHHQVHISSAAVDAAIMLTNRYMPNRRQPDKSIDVLDQACARYRLRRVSMQLRAKKSSKPTASPNATSHPEKLTPHDIRKIVSSATSIPVEEITAAERQQIENLDQILKKRVIGQDTAVDRVVSAIKKSKAGMADPNRPDSVMLFLGPTGVGKTQLAKALSEVVFGSDKHLITFDMSEYIEQHSVSRLIGAPPGYVGSDEEGRLTGAVMNTPFSILLFDEIEKANERIFDIFLPMLDEGRLKDSLGRNVSFRNTIIIFTSNIGAELLSEQKNKHSEEQITEELLKHFRPEFINRIDEVVPFYPLLFEDIRHILKHCFTDVASRLRDKGIKLRVFQGAYEYLAEKGYNRDFGARELRRTVDRLVINPISELVLSEQFQPGDYVEVLMEDEKLTFRRKADDSIKEGASR